MELLLFEWKPRSFIPVAVAVRIGSLAAGPVRRRSAVSRAVRHELALVGIALCAGLGILTGFAWVS